MTFVRSGNTITQSGTDTNLTGLSAITDVVTTTKGHKKVYLLDFASCRLDVAGSLQWDPDYEELHFKTNTVDDFFRVLSGGLLKIGLEKIVNGKLRYSSGDALVMPRENASQFKINSLNINSGGLFEWRGGVIYSADTMGVIGTASALAFHCFSGRFVTSSNTIGTNGNTMICRNDGPASKVIIDAVILDAVDPARNAPIIYSTNGLSNVAFTALTGFIQTRGGSNGPAALKGVRFADNAFLDGDYQFNGTGVNSDAQPYEITNLDVGTGLRTYQSLNRVGHIAIFQDLDGSVSDPDAVPVEGAKRLLQTTDGGNRIDPGNSDYRSGKSFIGSTYDAYTDISDVAGQFPQSLILIGRIFYTTLGIAPPTYDLYSVGQTPGADDFILKYIHYNYNLAQSNAILHSAIPVVDDKPLILDTLITELDKAATDARTTAVDPYEAYDSGKAFLYDNYAGEVALIVGRAGNTLLPGIKDADIDATAATSFDFDYVNKVTLGATLFTGSIATTGMVTVLNGATVTDGTISNLTLPDLLNLSNVDVTGNLVTGTAGQHTLDSCNINDIINTSGGIVDMILTNGSTVANVTGPDVNILVLAIIRVKGGGLWTHKIINSDTGDVIAGYNATAATLIAFVPQSINMRIYAIAPDSDEKVVNINSGLSGIDAEIELIPNGFINTALDPSPYLLPANTEYSVEGTGAASVFSVTWDDIGWAVETPMTKRIIQEIKNASEEYADVSLAINTSLIVRIEEAKIRVDYPHFEMWLTNNFPGNQGVEFYTFFDVALARAIDPLYTVNPRTASGKRVDVLPVPVGIDIGVMAARVAVAVWEYIISNINIVGSAGKKLREAFGVDDRETIDAIETKAQADARQVLLIAEHDSTQAAIGGLATGVSGIEALVDDTNKMQHSDEELTAGVYTLREKGTANILEQKNYAQTDDDMELK